MATSGTEAGQFAPLSGVAVVGSGDVYVAEGDNRLDELTQSGRFLRALARRSTSPTAATCAPRRVGAGWAPPAATQANSPACSASRWAARRDLHRRLRQRADRRVQPLREQRTGGGRRLVLDDPEHGIDDRRPGERGARERHRRRRRPADGRQLHRPLPRHARPQPGWDVHVHAGRGIPGFGLVHLQRERRVRRLGLGRHGDDRGHRRPRRSSPTRHTRTDGAGSRSRSPIGMCLGSGVT